MTDSSGIERLWLFAREDVRDAVRERQAYVLGVLFVLLGAGMAYSAGRSVATTPSTVEIGLASRLLGPFVFLIPLVVLGSVAPALVEKRTTGALTVLLGLPFSRRTVVLGTLIGRSIVVSTAVLVAMLVALPIAVVMGVSVDPVPFVGAGLALVILTITFTAIAVAISAITRTSTRATFAAFGAYVAFVFQLWGTLPMVVLYVRHGFAYPATTPAWVEFVASLNPMTAFTNGVAGVLPSLADVTVGSPPTDPAFYERPVFALGILVAWIVVTVGLGYRRFRATDL